MNMLKKIGIGVVLILTSISSNAEVKSLTKSEIKCLTNLAYYEARGESTKGMIATIYVVLNRVKDSRFPNTPCSVISEPRQFSWYGKGYTVKEPELYERSKAVVRDVLNGKHVDYSRGALYFVHVKINRNWLEKLTYNCTIGNHKFFK